MTIDFEEGVTSRRVYELETGNKIFVERMDPYGFIEIRLERGEVPRSLWGQFTSYDEADKVVQQYINNRNKKSNREFPTPPTQVKSEAVA